MSEEFKVKDKISYRTMRSGTVFGAVIEVGSSTTGGQWVRWRVTSRSNPTYPLGHVEITDTPNPWFKKRAQ